MPYRDFGLEYPPGALPAFALPALVTETFSGYALAFETLMILCALLALAATNASLRRLRTPRAHSIVALVAVAISPLALATVALGRYDFLPVALVAVWLALELHDRHRPAAAVLGLAIAVKLYPVALLPIAFLWVGRRRGWREAALGAAVAAAVCACASFPFSCSRRAGSPTACSDSCDGRSRWRASEPPSSLPRSDCSARTSRSRPRAGR